MNASLRDTLHGLAPEPPDALGQPSTARRRAGALRRRRIAGAGTAVAAAFALVVTGNAVLTGTGDRAVAPAASSPLVGTFPDWPRRVSTPGVDEQAVTTWSDSVRARGAAVVGTPRVLYAGGGGARSAVVVLHATAFPGGDRVAVVTVAGGRATVVTDRRAPLPGTPAITVLLDAPPESTAGNDGCDTTDDPAHATRLLVVAAPGVTQARWRLTGLPGIDCGPGGSREDVPWQGVPLSGGENGRESEGTALFEVPFRDGANLDVEARVRGDWVRTGAGVAPRPMPYPAFERMRGIGTPLGWNIRTDHTRADDVAEHLPLPDGVRKAERCELELARSLPDGTAVVFCTVPSVVEGNTTEAEPVFVADDARGRFRTYVLPRGLHSHYATVVEGRTGRWLVFVDRPDQTSAALVENGVTRPIPLTHGTGYLELADGEGGSGARITTSDFGPDGGQALTIVEGREVERR